MARSRFLQRKLTRPAVTNTKPMLTPNETISNVRTVSRKEKNYNNLLKHNIVFFIVKWLILSFLQNSFFPLTKTNHSQTFLVCVLFWHGYNKPCLK